MNVYVMYHTNITQNFNGEFEIIFGKELKSIGPGDGGSMAHNNEP